MFLIYTPARRCINCLEAWAKKKKKRNRRMAGRRWCSLSCKFWAPLSTTSWNKDRKSGMILKRTDKKWISTQRQSPCCWWRGRDSSTLWDTAPGSTALLCDDDNTHPEIRLTAHTGHFKVLPFFLYMFLYIFFDPTFKDLALASFFYSCTAEIEFNRAPTDSASLPQHPCGLTQIIIFQF